MNQVKELLRKHDYITVAQKCGDGCIVVYPHPKLVDDSPRLVESFSFTRGDKPGFFLSTSHDTDGQIEKFVPVSEYIIRLYVLTAIMLRNAKIPFDPSTMLYVSENNTEAVCIGDIIDEPHTEEEKEKENKLANLLTDARNNGFPAEYDDIANSLGIGEGYSIIRKFYE